jgi:3-(3-hydroxy-phenyl)propionate hydroxylase
VPIFGVRRLNNGLADAENIGWKLALVLHGEADERLLDSYSPGGAAPRSTCSPTPPEHALHDAADPRLARRRAAALSLSLKHEFPRGLANRARCSPTPIRKSHVTPYAERSAEFAGRPSCGSVAPNAGLADGSYLLDRGNGA